MSNPKKEPFPLIWVSAGAKGGRTATKGRVDLVEGEIGRLTRWGNGNE